jgi:hypothetical protein
VAPWIVNNYKGRNPHAVVKLFWHSIESDAQQKSFQRMSRRQDSRWINVMVLTGDSHSSLFTSLSSFCTRRERRFGSARLQIQMWVSSSNLHYFSSSGRGDLFSAFLNIGEEHRPATSAHRLFQS